MDAISMAVDMYASSDRPKGLTKIQIDPEWKLWQPVFDLVYRNLHALKHSRMPTPKEQTLICLDDATIWISSCSASKQVSFR